MTTSPSQLTCGVSAGKLSVMSDVSTPFRRAFPDKRPAIRRETYLAACRAKGAVNQEQRAELFGMPAKSVYRYEHNQVDPRVSTAQWIAGRLDLTIDDLWPTA